MYYKNNSTGTKTYHGVTFKPGEIHQVNGYINNIKFEQVDAPVVERKLTPKVETKLKPNNLTLNKSTKSAPVDNKKADTDKSAKDTTKKEDNKEVKVNGTNIDKRD